MDSSYGSQEEESSRIVSDRELLNAIRAKRNSAGDPCEILCNRYYQVVCAYVQQCLFPISWQDAEDLTQEIFVKVFAAVNRFNVDKSFKPWLFAIAKNTKIDFLRNPKRKWEAENIILVDNADLQNVAIKNCHSHKISQEERFIINEALYQCLARLSPLENEVLILKYLGGLKDKQVAGNLGIPPGTVGSIAHRARQKIISYSKHQPGVGRGHHSAASLGVNE